MPSLSESEIAAQLAPFGVELPASALSQLRRYLELLLHWNQRINLTSIRDPKAIVRRLFAESLAIARTVELGGWLVDVGSGAGFPGLALKLVAPNLRVTLIEARQKKCAFLREVSRQCGFTGVEVVAQRFEDWASNAQEKPDLITTRAVSVDRKLFRTIKIVLAHTGRVVLVTSSDQSRRIQQEHGEFAWSVSSPGGNVDTVVVVGHML